MTMATRWRVIHIDVGHLLIFEVPVKKARTMLYDASHESPGSNAPSPVYETHSVIPFFPLQQLAVLETLQQL